MQFLVLIGIPVRFVFYVLIHVMLGLLDPQRIEKDDNDWQWVITGVDKYRRNNGRQLI
jgi:hypothetical protein